MKPVIAGLIIAASLVGTSFVAMAPSPALAWYCFSRGTTGATGWATRFWIRDAKAVSLAECAVRTPRYGRCYVQFCR
jgi:hypothetical protein